MEKYVYYKMYFNREINPVPQWEEPVMGGKGFRVPTLEEANIFYQSQVQGFANGLPIVEILEISKKEAEGLNDFANEANWPVFGIEYFEMFFNREINPVPQWEEPAMCGKGVRIPTVEEANIFYKSDVQGYAKGLPVVQVCEISREKAAGLYDFRNEADWPVFGIGKDKEAE